MSVTPIFEPIEFVKEFFPAVLVGVHQTAHVAFVLAGCTDQDATIAENTLNSGSCNVVSIAARIISMEMAGQSACAAVQVDPSALDLACVTELKPGHFGLFAGLASQSSPGEDAVEDLVKELTAITGQRWACIGRLRQVGFATPTAS